MDNRYLSNVVKFIVLSLAIMILLVQVGFQIADFMVRSIEVLPVTSVSEDQCVTSSGYIVRSEITLERTIDGVLSPTVPDGTRVSVGDVVAELYDDNEIQSDLLRELSMVLHQRSLLDQAISQKGSFSAGAADREIARLKSEIDMLTAEGKTAGIDTISDTLQIMLYIRQLKSGNDLSDVKEAIENKISNLKNQVGGALASITCDESGYYFSACDGYETRISMSELDKASSSELRALLDRNIEPQISASSAGKIVTDYKWAVVVEVSFNDAQNFVQGNTYEVKLEELGEEKISMNLQRSIVEYGSDTVLLVFSCTDMPVGFSYSRYQNVSIVIGQTQGYRLPISSIRQLNGVTGVYVLRGSVVEFREISPVIMTNGAVLVDSSAEPTGEYPMLGFYDIVIVRGKELHVGKIISQ